MHRTWSEAAEHPSRTCPPSTTCPQCPGPPLLSDRSPPLPFLTLAREITRGGGHQQDGAPQQPRRAPASHPSNRPDAGRAGNSPPLIRNSALHSRMEEKATLSPALNWSLCARFPRAG